MIRLISSFRSIDIPVVASRGALPSDASDNPPAQSRSIHKSPADEKLTALLELESAIRHAIRPANYGQPEEDGHRSHGTQGLIRLLASRSPGESEVMEIGFSGKCGVMRAK